jgi:hypothetical protein
MKDTTIKYLPLVIIRYEKNSDDYLRTCALRSACFGSWVFATRKKHGNSNPCHNANPLYSYSIGNANCSFFDARTNPDPAFLLGY